MLEHCFAKEMVFFGWMMSKFNNVEFPKFAVCRFNYEDKLTALLVEFGVLSYGAFDLLDQCFSNIFVPWPFTLETSLLPLSLINQTRGGSFKEIDLHHGPHFSAMVMVGGLHKTAKYWEIFQWGTVVDHFAYESTSGFFALRALRSQPKVTQWSIGGSVWAFPTPLCCFMTYRPLCFVRPIIPQKNRH